MTQHWATSTCPHCGGPGAELLEVWDGRDFMVMACCEELQEEVDYELRYPDAAAAMLNAMGASELGHGELRRVAEADERLVLDWAIRLAPVPQAEAKAFVAAHHSHNRPPAGDRFRAGIFNGPTLLGVIMVGRPVARMIDATTTVEVTRLCLDLDLSETLRWKACSTAYAWAAREAERRGFSRIITYTLASETGMSLRYARWKREGEAGGGSWNRRSRPRQDTAPVTPKVRWSRALRVSACQREDMAA